MKICPLCNREYENTDIGFCADDGKALIDQTVATPPAMAFSPSLAMTLFSHRFIENLPPGGYGIQSFCQPEINVKSWQFLTEVPMIAFWYLRENNCIRFTQTYRQGFIRNSPTLVIEASPAGQVTVPGLEYDFWEIIKHSKSAMTVETVFTRFLGGHRMDPEKKVYERLIAWMIQFGYGQPDNSPKPFIRFGDIPPFEKFAPDCSRIVSQEPAAQVVHQRWMKFKAEERELFYYLFDDVVDAAVDRIGNSQTRSSTYLSARSFRDTDKE